jgi:hypothetical protein
MKKIINYIIALHYNITLPIVLIAFIRAGILYYLESNNKYWIFIGVVLSLIPYQIKFIKGVLDKGFFFYKEYSGYKRVSDNLKKFKISLD